MQQINKLQLSGIAILMVILCHTGISVFYPGFMGVDVFFFLSGYYLCNSYKRHSITDFYKRRYKRIIPMFLILAIVMSLINNYTHKGITTWELIWNITTISYYIPSLNFVDWYLSSLFAFYLIFPILYKLMSSKWNLLFLLAILLSTFIVFLFFNIHWRYECAIGRLPIYCMGILTYNQIQNKERLYKPFIFAIISIILLIPALMLHYKNKINTYYLFYLIAPIFIILLNKLNNKIQYNKNIDRCLQFLGKYSLPIYVANIIALNSYYFIGIGHRALLTILLTLILGVLCVLYNKYTDKIIDKLS